VTSTCWRKAVRDVWQARTRTVFVVLAIALGIAAFSTVMSTYAILVRELNRGYLATNPASAVLRTDRVDDALLRAAGGVRGVGAVQARRRLSARVKVGPMEWRSLVLFVVEDYARIRISRIEPQAGAWPPGTGEMLIERDALQVAHARIGDTLSVRTAAGREARLRVSGTVHDVGQAQARMENVVYGYVTLPTLERLGEEPHLDELQMLVAENALDEAHVRRVARRLKQALESRGRPVLGMDVPRPGKHPHAEIMGLLLLAQAAFGLLALALSGILVVNLLTALLASEVRQIGVMKALGGTRARIAGIYLGQALLLGLAALGVAIPLGMWGSRVLCRSMAGLLNFDIASFSVPAWVYLLDALVGVLVPLAAAAWPVAKGTRLTVAEALSDFGVGPSAFGTSGLDRALARVGGTTRPLLLAVRNGFRRRARLALTAATLAAAGAFFMSALNVRASLVHTLDRLFATRSYDLSVRLATLYPFAKVERALAGVPGVARAEGWITTEAALVAGADEDGFSVVALPEVTRLFAPEIVEGRGLRQGDVDALVMNDALAARDPRMKVGGEVTLRMGPGDSAWRIVGRAREPFSPATAYVSLRRIEELGGQAGAANSVRVALEGSDAPSIARVRAALEQGLEREQVRVAGSATQADGRYGFDQHMLMIYVFLLVVSAILLGVGGLGLMTTMSLNVLERRREMGVLRAIGASPPAVCLIVVAEACAIALMGFALAAVLAWPLSRLLGDGLMAVMFRSRLDDVFEARGLAVWLAVSILLGVVAGLAPAWQAARRPVSEAILYE
jgi:putative ABC transport system permease protein